MKNAIAVALLIGFSAISHAAKADPRWPSDGRWANNSPFSQLEFGYELYAFVKFCHDRRKGFLVTFVNDEEFADARERITELENRMKPKIFPPMDDDALRRVFDDAAHSLSGMWLTRQTCQISYRDLVKLTGGFSIKKDF